MGGTTLHAGIVAQWFICDSMFSWTVCNMGGTTLHAAILSTVV